MAENFIIGTYTNKDSQGIYRVTLNAGKLEKVRLAVKVQKPSYLQVGTNHLIYTIKKGQDGQKGVAIYKLAGDNPEDAKLVDEQLFAAPSPAYIGLDEQRHLLFAANYHGSRVDVFALGPDNDRLERTDVVTHTGVTGPAPEQDIPHIHYADLTPDGRLVTCDLGLDLVTIYDILPGGKLAEVSCYHEEPGFGPRHLAFHPNGRYAYILGELSSELDVVKYDSTTGRFTRVQRIKTIPANWTAHNAAGAIWLSQDGKFVYTSNRGENTIAVFKINPNFTVDHIQSISSEGDYPRDFNLSSNEKYLVVANQNSENLALYQRSLGTGKLTLLQRNIFCPEPICVQKGW